MDPNYGMLNCNKLSEYCLAWRSGLRQIWILPNMFCSDYLSVVSGTLEALRNVLYKFKTYLLLTLVRYTMKCRHFLNFITTCHSSDSELIRSVIKHAIFCARVQSPVGHNYVLCYET